VNARDDAYFAVWPSAGLRGQHPLRDDVSIHHLEIQLAANPTMRKPNLLKNEPRSHGFHGFKTGRFLQQGN